MRVGFIGLGSQGAPIARRILDGGFRVTLWARRPASTEVFGDTAAAVAKTPRELASGTDLICICVVNDTDVAQVIEGSDGVLAGARSGAIIAIHSTVHPTTCHRLAEKASLAGVSIIDAPVSGGGRAATEGKLLVMAGGDKHVVDRCKPVFETYSDSIVHLGALGAGQITKLINNTVFTANIGIAASALSLGEGLGLDASGLLDVISRGSGNSYAANAIRGIGMFENLAPVAGPLLAKDARLMREVVASAGVAPGLVNDAADSALTVMGHPR